MNEEFEHSLRPGSCGQTLEKRQNKPAQESGLLYCRDSATNELYELHQGFRGSRNLKGACCIELLEAAKASLRSFASFFDKPLGIRFR